MTRPHRRYRHQHDQLPITANRTKTRTGAGGPKTANFSVIDTVYASRRSLIVLKATALQQRYALKHGKDLTVDPNPDYDVSDELEYGIDWFAWILRSVYPPSAYPPSYKPPQHSD